MELLQVFNLGDKFVFLCFSLYVNVVNLEWGQHQPHSFEIVNKIVTIYNIKEEIHMVKNEAPQ